MPFASGFPRPEARSRTALAAWMLWVLCAAVLFADAESTIRFTWAVVYRCSDQQVRAIDYSESIMRLQSGDKLKFYLRPLSPCHFYVYLHDSQKNLRLLFPEGPDFRESLQVDRSYGLPQGDNWFYLDESGGIELFYLIVSGHRLRKLEALTEKLLARKMSRSDQPLIGEYKVLDEIKRIIKQSSSLADTVQQPIPVAGDLRGITEETEVLGIGVQAKSIYVKTIRLEH